MHKSESHSERFTKMLKPLCSDSPSVVSITGKKESVKDWEMEGLVFFKLMNTLIKVLWLMKRTIKSAKEESP